MSRDLLKRAKLSQLKKVSRIKTNPLISCAIEQALRKQKKEEAKANKKAIA